MNERPILFSGEMVRAILDGTKTQTRRVIRKPKQVSDSAFNEAMAMANRNGWHGAQKRGPEDGIVWRIGCPYGVPGDRLWVRETFAFDRCFDARRPSHTNEAFTRWYSADNSKAGPSNVNDQRGRWRPSIHMPRWASRITLEVTDVRVHQLHKMTEDDVRAEGIPGAESIGWGRLAVLWTELWDGINAKRGYSWESNPWVFAISFRRIEP